MGDSTAHAMGVGPRWSSEGDILGKAMPAEGLKLITKNCSES